MQWDEISRDYDRFLHWMQTFVLETKDFSEYLEKLREAKYV
jgi:hypothetical protein